MLFNFAVKQHFHLWIATHHAYRNNKLHKAVYKLFCFGDNQLVAYFNCITAFAPLLIAHETYRRYKRLAGMDTLMAIMGVIDHI